ncbi:hypothetical protein [Streptomyces roseolus]
MGLEAERLLDDPAARLVRGGAHQAVPGHGQVPAGGVPLLTACATGEKDGTTSGNGVAKPLPAHVPGDVVTPDAPARDGTTVGSVLTLDRFGAAVLEEQP